MVATMKALVYEGPRVMNMREVERPEAGPSDVVIRVEGAGICGSELSGYLGENSLRTPPLVMGHEFAGTISAVGDSVERFEVEDRVTANPLVSCERCDYCRSGAAQLCARRALLGAHRPGAYAEYVTVPESNTYPLRESVSFRQGVLVEPAACAVHICRLALLAPTDRVLVIGAGPIGLLTLQTAREFGVRDVVVLETNQDRLQIARDCGGIGVASPEDLDDDGFDVAVDAVGLEVTRQQCVKSLRASGTVVFSGLHSADSVLPINSIIREEIVLRGTFAYSPKDFETALAWLSEGRLDITPWVIEAPLEDGAEQFERLLSNPGKVTKVMLRP